MSSLWLVRMRLKCEHIDFHGFHCDVHPVGHFRNWIDSQRGGDGVIQRGLEAALKIMALTNLVRCQLLERTCAVRSQDLTAMRILYLLSPYRLR